MKFYLGSIIVLASSAAAFSPSLRQSQSSSVETSLHSTTTRGDFLNQIGATFVVAGGISTAVFAPAPANAGWATGPGSAVLDPKDAIVDEEIFKTPVVQKALKSVKAYSSSVTAMKKTLASNSQADLKPIIRKEFDLGNVRADLNSLNSAFEEDTQKGTDRLIRVILQDLNELEVTNAQKAGVQRSEIRVSKMNGKLDKLQVAFDSFLKFSPPAVKVAPPPPPPVVVPVAVEEEKVAEAV